MKYIENIKYNYDEFDKMLTDLHIFENNIPIATNIDNAYRKPMNEKHFQQLQNVL